MKLSDTRIVLNGEFVNTGGNCMVYVTSFIDIELNQTFYMAVSDEGFVTSTVDTIRNDIEYREEYTINVDTLKTHSFRDPKVATDDRMLYDYCWQQYIYEYCKYFHTVYELDVDDLPQSLYNQVTADYNYWLKATDRKVTTDGSVIIVEKTYMSGCSKQLINISKLLDYLEYCLEDMSNDHNITISIDDKVYSFLKFFTYRILASY